MGFPFGDRNGPNGSTASPATLTTAPQYLRRQQRGEPSQVSPPQVQSQAFSPLGPGPGAQGRGRAAEVAAGHFQQPLREPGLQPAAGSRSRSQPGASSPAALPQAPPRARRAPCPAGRRPSPRPPVRASEWPVPCISLSFLASQLPQHAPPTGPGLSDPLPQTPSPGKVDEDRQEGKARNLRPRL